MGSVERAGVALAFEASEGEGPGVAFLGGYRSDMNGTKALHLEAWARARGRAFLRLDYSGHGASGGRFADGTIGAWSADAAHVIAQAARGPLVLVGSSMGGWIALLLARDRPELVAGLVTIAAAPDFTLDLEAGLTEAERAALARDGVIHRHSDYGDLYPFTRALIEDGRRNAVLGAPLRLAVPVRMMQGTDDADVSQDTALRLLAHLEASDARLTLVKGADHRFSDPACLALVERGVEEVLAAL